MNNIIPSFNPFKTSLVCKFSNVDSRVISRHHKKAIRIIIVILIHKFWKLVIGILLKMFAVKKTELKIWKEARIGQGLKVTKWKGCIFIFS